MPRTLDQWLDYQQTVHPRSIALGLERAREVAARLGLRRPAPLVISVAGTNGKGSCVALLTAMLEAAGLRVGAYTSPHLLDYRERIRLPHGLVDAAALVEAFERIEQARGTVQLTFFEYGTLAALDLFQRAGLDAAVLEVGLGGRLDAVNLVDPDAALITTIDLDHQELLGPDRAAIAREKAGILRPGIPAVYADQPPVAALLEVAQRLGTRLLLPGRDYRYWIEAAAQVGVPARCRLLHQDTLLDLPLPPELRAPCQVHNLAACATLLRALPAQHGITARALADGSRAARLGGRLQRLADAPETWLDIAHNQQAARSLAEWLALQPARPTAAVFGALADKDVAAVVQALAPLIPEWHLIGLDRASARGLGASDLVSRLPSGLLWHCHADAGTALAAARRAVGHDGRVIAFGSFVLASLVLQAMPLHVAP